MMSTIDNKEIFIVFTSNDDVFAVCDTLEIAKEMAETYRKTWYPEDKYSLKFIGQDEIGVFSCNVLENGEIVHKNFIEIEKYRMNERLF